MGWGADLVGDVVDTAKDVGTVAVDSVQDIASDTADVFDASIDAVAGALPALLRPEGTNGADIYAWFHEGVGTGSIDDAVAGWGGVSRHHEDTARAVHTALGKLDASWAGAASGAAQDGAEPLRRAADRAGESATDAATALRAQSEGFHHAKQQVVKVPADPPQLTLFPPAHPVAVAGKAAESHQFQAQQQSNQAALAEYGATTSENQARVPVFDVAGRRDPDLAVHGRAATSTLLGGAPSESGVVVTATGTQPSYADDGVRSGPGTSGTGTVAPGSGLDTGPGREPGQQRGGLGSAPLPSAPAATDPSRAAPTPRVDPATPRADPATPRVDTAVPRHDMPLPREQVAPRVVPTPPQWRDSPPWEDDRSRSGGRLVRGKGERSDGNAPHSTESAWDHYEPIDMDSAGPGTSAGVAAGAAALVAGGGAVVGGAIVGESAGTGRGVPAGGSGSTPGSGQNAGRAAGGQSGTTSAPGASTTGSMSMRSQAAAGLPIAAGRGQPGADETDHDRPDYLVEANPHEVFGTKESVAPAVFGEKRKDPEPPAEAPRENEEPKK